MQVDDLRLYFKCHSSTGVFKHFASKNQLTGFYISGTLVENGLKSTLNQRKPLNKRELKTNSNEEVLSIAKVMTSFGSDYLRNVEYCF